MIFLFLKCTFITCKKYLQKKQSKYVNFFVRARICKPFEEPRRAGTTTIFVVSSRQAARTGFRNRFLGIDSWALQKFTNTALESVTTKGKQKCPYFSSFQVHIPRCKHYRLYLLMNVTLQFMFTFVHVYGVRQISFLFVIFANLSFGLFVTESIEIQKIFVTFYTGPVA